MVALLVRLKLTLLRNGLRRSVWRLVGLILAGVYALGVVGGAVIGLVALRYTTPALTADVTVLAFSALTAGWLVLSLLVFGVDETVDPAKFALMPVPARTLMPGLLVAGALGVPGVATVLVSLGLVVTWARSVPLTLAAVVAVALGVVTCLLLARAATAALAAFLSSRRFRDLAFVVLALVGGGIAIVGNLIGSVAGVDSDRLRGALTTAALIAGWTPFGWAWALPADLARGAVGVAVAHLVLAVALLVALWFGWGHFLAARLVEPIEGEGASAQVRASSWVDRLYPATPAGGVAARTLRYWRRDPRYLAAVAGFLIGPVVLMVITLTDPGADPLLAMLAPTLIGLLIGVGLAGDLSYDGSALWLHVSAGVDGAADRLGRVLSMLTIFVPLLVVVTAVVTVVSGAWSRLPVVLGLTSALLGAGLGAGSLVGTLWQWPAPPPGASPFQKSNSGSLPALLSFSVSLLATVVVALPTIALSVWSFWAPWAGWVAVPVGLANGLVALRFGIVGGGRVLDRRWPEVMLAVSERTG